MLLKNLHHTDVNVAQKRIKKQVYLNVKSNKSALVMFLGSECAILLRLCNT